MATRKMNFYPGRCFLSALSRSITASPSPPLTTLGGAREGGRGSIKLHGLGPHRRELQAQEASSTSSKVHVASLLPPPLRLPMLACSLSLNK